MAVSYVPKRRRYGPRGIGIMGLLGLGARLPGRITGVAQRATHAVPERCPKCQSASLFADLTEARRLWCFSCGEDLFLVREG